MIVEGQGKFTLTEDYKIYYRKKLIDHYYVNPVTFCWIWTGSLRNGYARIVINEKKVSAARLSLAVYKEFDLDSELDVLHKCDNTRCINPEHLFPGTAANNIQDMMDKNRNYQQNKTHCKYGHEFSGPNLVVYNSKYNKVHRRCGVCIKNEREKNISERKEVRKLLQIKGFYK